jgi:hypothetical protein
LEGIFRVLMVSEDTTTHTPHHRAVPPHEGGEGSFVPVLEEAPKELPIGQPGPVVQKRGPAKVPDDLVHLARRHVSPSANNKARPLLLLPARGGFDALFFPGDAAVLEQPAHRTNDQMESLVTA